MRFPFVLAHKLADARMKRQALPAYALTERYETQIIARPPRLRLRFITLQKLWSNFL